MVAGYYHSFPGRKEVWVSGKRGLVKTTELVKGEERGKPVKHSCFKRQDMVSLEQCAAIRERTTPEGMISDTKTPRSETGHP